MTRRPAPRTPFSETPLVSVSVEDCLAMDENYDWVAWRKTDCTRGQAMMAVGDRDDLGITIRHFRVVSRHMRPTPSPEGGGQLWHEFCSADDPAAIPVWLAERKAAS